MTISCHIERVPNWEELSQRLFNRISKEDKLKILLYVQSPNHEITVEDDLK